MKGNGFVYELNEEIFGVTEEELQKAEEDLPPMGLEDTEFGEAIDEVKRLVALGHKIGSELAKLMEENEKLHAELIHDDEKCKEVSKQIGEKGRLLKLYRNILWESVSRSLELKNDCSVGLRKGWKVVSFVSPEEKLITSLEDFSNLLVKDLSEAVLLRKMFD